MLESVNYPDMEVVSEMVQGTQLTGIIPPTGIFEKAFKPAESTVGMLMDGSASKGFADTSSGEQAFWPQTRRR